MLVYRSFTFTKSVNNILKLLIIEIAFNFSCASAQCDDFLKLIVFESDIAYAKETIEFLK